MTNITVADFANELKRPTDTLMEQLQAAGVSKQSASDALTDADKQKLLNYLQASHGTDASARRKITLTKKTTSEIKQADATGKARTIQVEVRKKRTFIKRDDEVPAAPAAEPAQEPATAAPVVDAAELARREEEARRQAELLRRQEEELAQKRREREIEVEAERFAELATRTNETLARLRDACDYLGIFASEAERNNAAAACQDLLALVAEARTAGVPAEVPLMRTLRRSEPIVLRIQDRLDAWAQASRINALLRNRNLAQGVGGIFFSLFMFAAQVLSRFLIWLIIIPAAIFGWRMWGIVELRNAIRELGRSLPARVPQS